MSVHNPLVKMTYAEFEDFLTKPNIETDPTGRSPKQPGAKLDAGKSPVFRGLLDYFPRACLAVAEISEVGALKYTWKGWESVPDGINRYADAGARHILKESVEGPVDPDTGKLHKAHKAWNAFAELELYLREQESIINGKSSVPLDRG